MSATASTELSNAIARAFEPPQSIRESAYVRRTFRGARSLTPAAVHLQQLHQLQAGILEQRAKEREQREAETKRVAEERRLADEAAIQALMSPTSEAEQRRVDVFKLAASAFAQSVFRHPNVMASAVPDPLLECRSPRTSAFHTAPEYMDDVGSPLTSVRDLPPIPPPSVSETYFTLHKDAPASTADQSPKSQARRLLDQRPVVDVDEPTRDVRLTESLAAGEQALAKARQAMAAAAAAQPPALVQTSSQPRVVETSDMVAARRRPLYREPVERAQIAPHVDTETRPFASIRTPLPSPSNNVPTEDASTVNTISIDSGSPPTDPTQTGLWRIQQLLDKHQPKIAPTEIELPARAVSVQTSRPQSELDFMVRLGAASQPVMTPRTGTLTQLTAAARAPSSNGTDVARPFSAALRQAAEAWMTNAASNADMTAAVLDRPDSAIPNDFSRPSTSMRRTATETTPLPSFSPHPQRLTAADARRLAEYVASLVSPAEADARAVPAVRLLHVRPKSTDATSRRPWSAVRQQSGTRPMSGRPRSSLTMHASRPRSAHPQVTTLRSPLTDDTASNAEKRVVSSEVEREIADARRLLTARLPELTAAFTEAARQASTYSNVYSAIMKQLWMALSQESETCLSAALSRLDSLSASTAQQLDSLRAQHELSLATARQEMDELRSTLTALQNQRDNTISSSVSSDAHAVADSHLQMAERAERLEAECLRQAATLKSMRAQLVQLLEEKNASSEAQRRTDSVPRAEFDRVRSEYSARFLTQDARMHELRKENAELLVQWTSTEAQFNGLQSSLDNTTVERDRAVRAEAELTEQLSALKQAHDSLVAKTAHMRFEHDSRGTQTEVESATPSMPGGAMTRRMSFSARQTARQLSNTDLAPSKTSANAS